MKVTSSAFEDGGPIPSEFTCDGQDVSPPLAISDVPNGAKSLAIIMDDPDAPMGTFTHWVVWNIPPQKSEFTTGEKIQAPHGKTSFGRKSYGGPCPPGGTHRYFFKVFALDTMLEIKDGSSRNGLEKAMMGHILSESALMGKYSRR
ncbi:MAG: YbhB/YbcL family Raf kinase inhibitor-like protein [Thaumarchaeota archaeon]|nr:YbhB/YbcL family Raf kinase inhibitor-like protein [Nitrososphaerota archaeon]